MTDADWLASNDLALMLRFIRLRLDDRKLRLFACACCRLVWDSLPHDACRRAVELGEAYADDRLDDAERESARRELNRILEGERGLRGRLGQASEQLLRPRFDPLLVAERARTGMYPRVFATRQCELLRDVVGDPFQRIKCPALEAEIVDLARTIYETQSFSQLSALTDRLAKTQNTPPSIVDHLRQPAHVRGCWALDIVAGITRS